ncbi:TPA: phage holin family protein [Escherichia coli]|nr:phage holin family protein [Escherichia coli]
MANLPNLNSEPKLDRQTIQMIASFLNQYGVFHGLLAGLTALIRGAYENEGRVKRLLDALLCTLIGTFVFSLPLLDTYLVDHPKAALVICIVIGIVGANLIITTMRETFTAAIKQLNPLNWFKKKV